MLKNILKKIKLGSLSLDVVKEDLLAIARLMLDKTKKSLKDKRVTFEIPQS